MGKSTDKPSFAVIVNAWVREHIGGVIATVLGLVISGVVTAFIIGDARFGKDAHPDLQRHSNFYFTVQTIEQASGKSLSNVLVSLELPGNAPLAVPTDSLGYARFNIEGVVGKQAATLNAASEGYHAYSQSIDVTDNSLPQKIQLTRLVQPQGVRSVASPLPNTTVTNAVNSELTFSVSDKPKSNTGTASVNVAKTTPVVEVSRPSGPVTRRYPCSGEVMGLNGVKLNRVRALPRENASSTSPAVGGAEVKIIDVNNDEWQKWYRINYGDGLSGWIPASYIAPSVGCPN